MFILGCLTVTILTIDKIMAQGSEIHIKIMMGKKQIKSDLEYNLQNISKTGLLEVVGVNNGENFVKNIYLDKLNEHTKQTSSGKNNGCNIR